MRVWKRVYLVIYMSTVKIETDVQLMNSNKQKLVLYTGKNNEGKLQ